MVMMVGDESGNRGIRIKRHELLAILKTNRAAHRDIFEKATEGYRVAAIAELDRAIAEARAGKRIRRELSLVEPMDQTKEYDRVIRMLELSVDEVVVIADDEFASYVMDDWRWKSQFTASNAAYLR